MASFDLTRRKALRAIAVSPAALVIPAEASAQTVRDPIDYHSRALIAALDDFGIGPWEMRVRSGQPDDDGRFLRFIGNPHREAMQALVDAQQALERLQPGRWRFNLDTDHAFALIIRDDGPLRADDVTGTTAYGGWERSKISS